MVRAAAVRLVTVLSLGLAITGSPGSAQDVAAPAPEISAKTWLDNQAQIEVLEDGERGHDGGTEGRRHEAAPGQARAWWSGGSLRVEGRASWPARRVLGKLQMEIAAYELDKLIGLNMVPPTVERKVNGSVGAAVMWCSPTTSFGQLKGVRRHPPSTSPRGTGSSRAQRCSITSLATRPIFGNWLVDPAWNLILIDHTRAFTTTRTWLTRRWITLTGRSGTRCRS